MSKDFVTLILIHKYPSPHHFSSAHEVFKASQKEHWKRSY